MMWSKRDQFPKYTNSSYSSISKQTNNPLKKLTKDINRHFSKKDISLSVSSVAQLCPNLCDPMDCSTPSFPVHHQMPELAQTQAHWSVTYPTISSSVVPFSCLQSFPAPGSFQICQFFTLGGQNIEVSASASVLPMNIQDWFPLGWNGWIALQSKGLSRVFSNTTVQKHQFFGAQLSL